ncbi:MAG: acetylornithine transaminase [Akkermansia sp.]|nr:acetylornithine transaminase [Akkermansia sp.]
MNTQYVLPTYGRAPITLVEGNGSLVRDSAGREYVDFAAGIATCSLGHCNPVVVNALCAQAHKLMHCSNLYGIGQQGELAELLVTRCFVYPGRVFFCNSGAEANDGIIKTARRFGHRRPAADGSPRYEVITFLKSFHGRTLGSMAATGQDKIKKEFDPMLHGFRHVPFNDIDALEAAIDGRTAAILLEAVQGEGGVNPATPAFLRAVARLCREHDLLLMMDEVQCGFGRCGAMFGWQAVAPELRPDCVSCAKGIAGGFPMGCFFVSDRAYDEAGTALSSIMDAGSHGSTFGGTPLACATAEATVKEILRLRLPKRAAQLGDWIRAEILGWHLPAVENVRGLGLLLGVALKPGLASAAGDVAPSAYVVGLLREKGLLTVAAGPDTVRIVPALTLPEDIARRGLDILHDVLKALS